MLDVLVYIYIYSLFVVKGLINSEICYLSCLLEISCWMSGSILKRVSLRLRLRNMDDSKKRKKGRKKKKDLSFVEHRCESKQWQRKGKFWFAARFKNHRIGTTRYDWCNSDYYSRALYPLTLHAANNFVAQRDGRLISRDNPSPFDSIRSVRFTPPSKQPF